MVKIKIRPVQPIFTFHITLARLSGNLMVRTPSSGTKLAEGKGSSVRKGLKGKQSGKLQNRFSLIAS